MRALVYVILSCLVAAMGLCGCKEERKYHVPNVGDGESTPTMSTQDVHTYISDSGYTKYYIIAPRWDMYEDASDPFWLFPKGVNLEQYDMNLALEATMRCDSARYYSLNRRWKLDGNVVMVNVRRDTFLTNQVFWDQSQRKIYSDSFVHIVKSDRIIEGYGFESNENMTSYLVKRPTGIFPVEKKDGDSSPSAASQQDTVAEETPDNGRRLAPAPRRASERDAMDEPGLLKFRINR